VLHFYLSKVLAKKKINTNSGVRSFKGGGPECWALVSQWGWREGASKGAPLERRFFFYLSSKGNEVV
jgi:hypothetical protein